MPLNKSQTVRSIRGWPPHPTPIPFLSPFFAIENDAVNDAVNANTVPTSFFALVITMALSTLSIHGIRRHGLMKLRRHGTAYYSNSYCQSDFENFRRDTHRRDHLGLGQSKRSWSLLMFGCATAISASNLTSTCDDGNIDASGLQPVNPALPHHPKADLLHRKALWPEGVSEADVDALVHVILEDPSINIALIPDSIEAAIYKSTIRLTLNVFYRLLSKLNGAPLLSHQIQVARVEQTRDTESMGTEDKTPSHYNAIAQVAQKSNASVNDEVLETIAERLLDNRAINQTLVPDAIERQLYQNCLKVIFRALQILSNSFQINLCGHDVQISIEPSSLEESALAATASSPSQFRIESEIDLELLQDFAFRAGIPKNESIEMSWWDQVMPRRRFMASLHASLYSLLLGIVDDVSSNW
eukprot:scaffold7212_cov165-Cylindrotheca_fusiformis.AAC.5